MNTTGGVEPEHAADVAEFVALMKRLKDASGLTYRQLEESAEREGRVLPRSTIADVLRRRALPRPQMLNAFVHACGAGDQADAWLRARNDLALGGGSPAATDGAPGADADGSRRPGAEAGEGDAGSAPAPPRPRRRAASPLVWASLSAALVAGIALWLLLSDPFGDSAGGGPSTAGPKAGWYSIRPAGAADLCVTEGRDPGGDTVAVQRPCSRSEPPYTRLEPLGDGRFFVKWAHPVHGWGCLTALDSGLLEPWDDCRSSRATQVFTFEPVTTAEPRASGTGRAETYRLRLRTAGGGQCLGVPDRGPEAAAVAGPCTDSTGQHFLLVPEAAPAASALPTASG